MKEHADIASVEEVELLLLTRPEVLRDIIAARAVFDLDIYKEFGGIPWSMLYPRREDYGNRRRVLRLRKFRAARDFAKELRVRTALQGIAHYDGLPPKLSDPQEVWRVWARTVRRQVEKREHTDWCDLLDNIERAGIHSVSVVNAVWCEARIRKCDTRVAYGEYLETILEHFGV